MVLEEAYDFLTGESAMAVAAFVLLGTGLMHVFSPSGTLVAQVLEMLGMNVTNSLSNFPGVVTRVVGVGVTGIGLGMARDLFM